MRTMNRRNLIAGLLAGGSAIAVGAACQTSAKTGRIVIVGGGPAGVAAALAARRANTGAHLLLLERDPSRLRADSEDRDAFQRPSLGNAMELLAVADIDVALDDIEAIDWPAKTAQALSGRAFAFDEIVLAPGTAARDEGIAGLDDRARHRWPAAWGSRREARRLAAQLAGMPEDGHVVVRLPAGELSHRQGLAHRAVWIAQYLQAKKTAAKLTVLDATGDLSAAEVFASAAAKAGFGKSVQWIGGGERARVLRVDAAAGVLETPLGTLKADVVNFITPQQAGPIAHAAGLVDKSGWCPCGADQRSLLNPAAFVAGDANRFAKRSLEGAMQSGLRAAQSLA